MLKIRVRNKISILYTALLLTGFVCIRLFEDVLFYDPFLNYYRHDFQNINLPELNDFKIALHFTLRYFLNAILSVVLLWVLFKDKSLINFSSFLYLLLFLCLLLTFFFVLFYCGNSGKMGLFYIRRFLIQPLFIIIFIPAFWYQKSGFHK